MKVSKILRPVNKGSQLGLFAKNEVKSLYDCQKHSICTNLKYFHGISTNPPFPLANAIKESRMRGESD